MFAQKSYSFVLNILINNNIRFVVRTHQGFHVDAREEKKIPLPREKCKNAFANKIVLEIFGQYITQCSAIQFDVMQTVSHIDVF